MNEMKKVDFAEVAMSSPPDAGVDQPSPNRRRRLALMLSVPLLLLLVGGWWWLNSGKTVGTDNAYIKQDITAISTQVSGPVVEVRVRENQRVEKGAVLFRIDQAPLMVALANAQAQLAAARLQTQQLRTQVSGTVGDIVGAEADLAIKQRAFARQADLLRQGFTTRSSYDDALNDVTKSRAELADARARSANASAAIAANGDQPQIAAAEAAVAKARLDLERSVVHAPTSGIVAKSDRLLVGQTAITGLSMLSIVGDQTAWVEANFKEGDLARMHVGLPATVKFDAYPGVRLKGHVASIGAGTGSEFSVLPAQNANGNWVKVTQRVPVRIAFDQKPPREMIAGLSAKVEVTLERQ